MEHWANRVRRKKRLNAEILKSGMRVYPRFQDLGKQVFSDGAISRKHKELMALAVAVSQNCSD